MTKFDYQKLGLKAGVEIHQQLSTNKLFCPCPSELRDDKPDYVLKRTFRSVAGETGKIDEAASQEHKKQKTYLYEGYDTNCQIEADMQPPNTINLEALNIGIQVSLMLKSKIIDSLQVMRKTVVDGSNTSGFQRTALIAINGSIITSEGMVSIPNISIEEDSARKIREDKDTTTYRLDRLGIPLIEIATGPDIKSPAQVKEVAEKLGMILRSTGKVKRGLGTIRQDINISIKDGQRIEIKGAQDLRMIPKLVENECIRQSNLVEIAKIIPKISHKLKIIDISRLFRDTKSSIIKKALQNSGVVLGQKLNGMTGFLAREIQPGRRLGSELSDYAKVIGGVRGIFHSDELPNYGISDKEKKEISLKLDCKSQDAFIIVADQPRKAEKAIEGALDRANLVHGVPREVRKANIDGTTSYLRPMPGAARLYPETDVIPTTPHIKHIKLPELLTDKAARICKKLNLSKDQSDILVKSKKFDIFENFVRDFPNIKPSYIAEILLTAEKRIEKEFKITIDPSDDDYYCLFSALDTNQISKDSSLEILSLINTNPIEELILDFKLMDDKDLEKEIKVLINKNKNMPQGAIIGKVMGKFKGKAEGKKIIDLVKKNL